MTTLTPHQETKLTQLERSMGIQDEGGALLSGESNPALCAAIKREVDLQYNFMFLYQTLLLLFAVIVLGLLALAAWRIATGAAVEAVLAGAGSLVSGTAAVYLSRQRTDARNAHTAARAGLEKYRCQ